MTALQLPPCSHGEAKPCRFPTTTSAFYHQVLTSPNATAVRDLSSGVPRQFTYQELDVCAQGVAKQLQAAGVRPAQQVPLVMKRGAEMIIGIFAILSCGAQYVPLDSCVVADCTLRHAVEECGKALVVCSVSSTARLSSLLPGVKTFTVDDCALQLDGGPSSERLDLARPPTGCYVIYTSGLLPLPLLLL